MTFLPPKTKFIPEQLAELIDGFITGEELFHPITKDNWHKWQEVIGLLQLKLDNLQQRVNEVKR